MAVKQWVRRLRPAPLYLTLGTTALYLVTQLFMSHTTHALTLLVDAYHMLCNLIALAGCIITIKYGSASADDGGAPQGPGAHAPAGCSEHHNKHYQLEYRKQPETAAVTAAGEVATGEVAAATTATAGTAATAATTAPTAAATAAPRRDGERRLKNTFGWARIDVLVMLIGCVFLTSLCFSLVVEALQTLVHIDHHDEMHHPIPVLVVGCVGLFVNALCYLFIGGYTFHQASFLHVTASGEVVLDHVMDQDSVRKGQRRLSAQARRPPSAPCHAQRPAPPRPAPRQGPREMCRDVVGCIYVIICAVIVYVIDKEYAKYIDPILSIVSAVTLLILSYPYMRESGSILLQTIPDTININALRKELLKAFPDILNVHDLHVWRLTASRVFSTAHIIFLNNKDYSRITKEITDFFHDQGITQVTIQPEFFQAENGNGIIALPNVHDDQCLVPCLGDGCYILHCCGNNGYKLTTVSVSPIENRKENKEEKVGEIVKRNKEHQAMKMKIHQQLEDYNSARKCKTNESNELHTNMNTFQTKQISTSTDSVISVEHPNANPQSSCCNSKVGLCSCNSTAIEQEENNLQSSSVCSASMSNINIRTNPASVLPAGTDGKYLSNLPTTLEDEINFTEIKSSETTISSAAVNSLNDELTKISSEETEENKLDKQTKGN